MGVIKQTPRETFVGDISIFQYYTELNLPNAFAKINSAGIFSLIVRSGLPLRGVVDTVNHLHVSLDLISEVMDQPHFAGRNGLT